MSRCHSASLPAKYKHFPQTARFRKTPLKKRLARNQTGPVSSSQFKATFPKIEILKKSYV
jgi:hypothetical protein